MSRHKREIWGLGVVGWIALSLLLGLIAGVAAGVDFRFMVLEFITETFGIDATFIVVARWMPWAWFAILGPEYSLLTAIYLTLALFLSGQKTPIWVYACVWGFGLFWPQLTFEAAQYELSLTGDRLLALSLMQPLPFIAFAIMARRWPAWLAVGVLASCNLGLIYIREFTLWQPQIPSVVIWFDAWVVAFHMALVATLIWWVRASSRGLEGERPCAKCGYELAGLSSGLVCPECGEAISSDS